MPSTAPPPVVTLVDLNDGLPNHGVPALEQLIRAAGAEPRRCAPRDLGTLDLGTRDPRVAAVVLSGGHGSPAEPRPWRDRLLTTLPALCRQQPVLGVCLGFQLLSLAHGFRVARMPRDRMGLYALRGWRDTLPAGATVLERRSFAVHAAPGAAGQPLARTRHGDLLAVRYSPLALGVAFHPEASPAAAAAWLSAPDTARAMNALHGPGAAQRHAADSPSLAGTWATLVPTFLERALSRRRRSPT